MKHVPYKKVIAPANAHDTSDGVRKLVKRLFGVDFTPLESSSEDDYKYRVSGFANESVGQFVENKGYTITLSVIPIDALDVELCEYASYDAHESEPYGKTIRTHDEFKAEMDRLWASSTYDERFVLKRLYEFLSEPYPRD